MKWTSSGMDSLDGRFSLQREHNLHEPVCYYLMSERLRPADRRAYERSSLDIIAFGKGAKQKVQRMCAQLAAEADAAES